MALIQLAAICLMFSAASFAERKYEYSECVYNVYKAACLGTNIRRRDCINCNLREFPVLSNKENCLMLKGNKIARFPDNFDNIKQLITLDLSENRLEMLPDNLDTLTNLQILDVSKNLLTVLSPTTRFPASLRGLLLAGNKMTTIPEGIKVPGLFVFDLSDNQFTEIPAHFCVSDQLIRVDVTRNPLRHDLSASIDILNKCRNVNEIPFCVYTDHEDFKCECDSLAPVLLQQPSFCMGNRKRNQPMTCSANRSSEHYNNQALIDISNRMDVVRDNCSYVLQLAGEGASVRTGVITTVITLLVFSMCRSSLG